MSISTNIMSKIDEYIKLFPEEIRDAMKSLSEDARTAIMIDLMMEPQGKTFSQLMTELEISQGLLDSHLKNLLENGLVKNEYRKVAGRRDYSFYLPTILGSSLMERLPDVLEKPIVCPVPTKAITYRVPSDIVIGTKALKGKPKTIDVIVTPTKQAPAPLLYRTHKTKQNTNIYKEITRKSSNPYLNHEEYLKPL